MVKKSEAFLSRQLLARSIHLKSMSLSYNYLVATTFVIVIGLSRLIYILNRPPPSHIS